MTEFMKEISIDDIFSEDGVLSAEVDGFEPREQQLKLARFMDDFFAEGGSALAEAGTGTGKTLAYLIPLAKYCIENGERAAVSTETKSLQLQLIDKEIPLIKKIFRDKFGAELKVSLCLGSSNYLCKRRYAEMINSGLVPLTASEKDLQTIESFAKKNRVTTMFDADVSKDLWSSVCRKSEFCFAAKCSRFSSCAFTLAREEWKEAHILIMNHYLYFSKIALGKNYLPKFEVSVLDEAHSAEQIASEQLGFGFSVNTLSSAVYFMHSKERKQVLGVIGDSAKRKNLEESFNELDVENRKFFMSLAQKDMFAGRRTFSLKENLDCGDDLIEAMTRVLKAYEECKDSANTEAQEYMILSSAKNAVFEAKQSLMMLCVRFENDWGYWAELDDRKEISLYGIPLDVSSYMRSEIYEASHATAFVSATLSVNGDFSFIKHSLGAQDSSEIALGSPFDYSSNMGIFIPESFPQSGSREIAENTAKIIHEIAELTDGNTMALFTSYDSLNMVCEELEEITDRKVYSQADLDAFRAAKYYIENPGSILLGTHSFWQGIDLKGDLLKSLVITKLPFLPPERPDVEAKSKYIEKCGGNSFSGYQLPAAVIKFKQGIGRLIRSSGDCGILALLDTRIVTKSYGRVFLSSLPHKKIKTKLSLFENFAERSFRKSDNMEEV